MLKRSENPPSLNHDRSAWTDLSGCWWVAHTKARFEKTFAWDLFRQNIPYFLPMMERVTISGGRKRHVLQPLFTSYVFFCGDELQRYWALTTKRLCQVIPITDQGTFIKQISWVQQALAGNAELDLHPVMAVGQSCRVTRGPFEGIEGTVIQRNGKARIVLHVKMLGRGAAMEIDNDLLELVECESESKQQVVQSNDKGSNVP